MRKLLHTFTFSPSLAIGFFLSRAQLNKGTQYSQFRRSKQNEKYLKKMIHIQNKIAFKPILG